MADQPLPQNIEAEQAVLGAILINGTAINQVFEILKPEDFHREVHRKIFRAMVELKERGDPIDPLSLFERFKGEKWFEEAGGSSYLTLLPELCPSATNVAYYARLVKEVAVRRHKRELALKTITAIDNNEDEAAINELIAELGQMEVSGDNRLKPVSAKDLEDTQPIESLWGEMFYPASIAQMNSEAGLGKTTLGYNIAYHGAKGSAFLGVKFSKPLKVLYIDLETPKWLRPNKLRAISQGAELPENLHFLSDLNLQKDFHQLLQLCNQEHYDLAFFDTQSRIFATKEENDNSEANRLMALLRRVTFEAGTCIVLVHHTGLSERSGVNSGRGATAVGGAADVIINLTALDRETIKMEVVKNRLMGDRPTLFVRKVGDDRFEPYAPPDEGGTGFEIFEVQDFILSLWEGNKEERILTTGEICRLGAEKEFPERTIKRALSRLVQSGKLFKPRHGQYSLRLKPESDPWEISAMTNS